MKEFLDEAYKNDPTKVFKLIEKGDEKLEAIRQKFSEKEIKVLEGNFFASNKTWQ